MDNLKDIKIIQVITFNRINKSREFSYNRNIIINDNLNIDYLFLGTKTGDIQYAYSLLDYFPKLKEKKIIYVDISTENYTENISIIIKKYDLLIGGVSFNHGYMNIIKSIMITHCHYSIFINEFGRNYIKKIGNKCPKLKCLICCNLSYNLSKNEDKNKKIIKLNSLPSFDNLKYIYNKYNSYKDYIVLLPGGAFNEDILIYYYEIINEIFPDRKIILKHKDFNIKKFKKINLKNLEIFEYSDKFSYDLFDCFACICIDKGSSFMESLSVNNKTLFTCLHDYNKLIKIDKYDLDINKILISYNKNNFINHLQIIKNNKDYFNNEYEDDKNKLFKYIYGDLYNNFNEEFENYLSNNITEFIN